MKSRNMKLESSTTFSSNFELFQNYNRARNLDAQKNNKTREDKLTDTLNKFADSVGGKLDSICKDVEEVKADVDEIKDKMQ